MNGLNVTDCKIHVVRTRGENSHLLAFARIVLNEVFVVSGIRVIQGEGGAFISFPREIKKEKVKPSNICYPIRREVHAEMTGIILTAYRAAVPA